MEESLGKRIVANRKRLGITQDRLAEQLGVTAQAVSKWENDQSCPDITMLPRLASIFGISVDNLLGLVDPEPEKVHALELAAHQEENENQDTQKGRWEFRWNAGKKPQIWFAVWVLLMGGMLLFNMLRPYVVISLWDMVWPSALMLFGLSGLYPKFSFFRLGCALLGGYALLEHMQITDLGLSGELLLIIALLLFGLSLLVDAIRKPEKSSFVIHHNGKSIRNTTGCVLGENSFESNVSFGEDSHLITLPQLKNGTVNVSFGECVVDLSGCEEILPGCRIDANCSFGELTIRVPKKYRVELSSSTSFASVEVTGRHNAETEGTITVEANASFGEVCINYI